MKNINLKKIFNKSSNNFDVTPVAVWPTHFAGDWKIIVSIFAVGLALLSFFAWQIYLSDRIGGGYLSPEAVLPNDSVNVLDTKKLKVDLKILENQQADYLKLQANSVRPIDPSL